MQKFWSFIDSMPTAALAVGAALLLLAPFFPEPHLLEKLRMASAGTLNKPIDILDVFMHASGALVLAIHVARRFRRRSDSESESP